MGQPFIEWSDHDCQVCSVAFKQSVTSKALRMENSDVAYGVQPLIPLGTSEYSLAIGPNPKSLLTSALPIESVEAMTVRIHE
jgi:hypothetical protein